MIQLSQEECSIIVDCCDCGHWKGEHRPHDGACRMVGCSCSAFQLRDYLALMGDRVMRLHRASPAPATHL